MVSAVCGLRSAAGSVLPLAHTGRLCRQLTHQPHAAMDPIAQAQAAVTKQGDTVRSLKEELKEGKIADKVRPHGAVGVCCLLV